MIGKFIELFLVQSVAAVDDPQAREPEVALLLLGRRSVADANGLDGGFAPWLDLAEADHLLEDPIGVGAMDEHEAVAVQEVLVERLAGLGRPAAPVGEDVADPVAEEQAADPLRQVKVRLLGVDEDERVGVLGRPWGRPASGP